MFPHQDAHPTLHQYSYLFFIVPPTKYVLTVHFGVHSEELYTQHLFFLRSLYLPISHPHPISTHPKNMDLIESLIYHISQSITMSSYQEIIAQHNQKLQLKQQKVDQANLALTKSIEEVTAATLTDVSDVSKKVYNSQKVVEDKATILQTETKKLLDQTQQWRQSLHQLNDSLKTLGDINNWCYTIEADMQFIAKALDSVVVETNRPLATNKVAKAAANDKYM